MAENETTSHCFSANNTGNSNKQFEFENSNALLRTGVWDVKEEKCIELNDTKYLSEDSNNIDSVKLDIGEDASLALKSYHLQPPDTDGESREVTEAVVSSTSNKLLKDDPSNEHSVCSIELVSKSKVWEPKEEQYLESNEIKTIADESNSTNFVRYNRAKEGAEKSDHLELLITDGKINDLTEPVPGSSNGPVKEEPSDSHTVWLPSTTIKSEAEGNESKCKSEEDEESEDEVGEEERLEEESEAEMDDDSNGGAYHLAEVSYGDEDEETQKSEGQEGDSILGMSVDYSHSFPDLNNEAISFGHQDILADSNFSKSENDETQKYACDKCDYKTNRKYNLKFHSMAHTEGASVLKCSVCTYKTNSRHQLISHHKVHKNNNMYVCSECDYTSWRTAAMKEHFRTHTGEKPYSCSECSFNCSSRNSLLKHKRTHTGETPYGCSVCGKRFKQSGHLTEHMRKHTGEKPFKCTICDYSCAYRCRINRHMEMHSDEKPFPCTVCPFRAKNRATINLHMRTHTGEHNYKCHICEYSCISSTQLKNHAYKHNGEALPFGCALCEAKFTRKSLLIIHLKAHEANKLLACSVCGMKYISRHKLKEHITNEHKQS